MDRGGGAGAVGREGALGARAGAERPPRERGIVEDWKKSFGGGLEMEEIDGLVGSCLTGQDMCSGGR